MSFFKDFGFTFSENRFDALLEQRAGAQPAAASRPTSDSPAPSQVPAKAVPRTSYTVVEKIPEQFKLKEGEKMKFNPYIDTPTGDASLVHGQYRQADSQSFSELKVRQAQPAIINFEASSGMEVAFVGEIPGPKASDEERKKVTIRVSYLTSTQFAGVRLHIHYPGRKEVHFKMFGSAFESRDINGVKKVGHDTVTFGPKGAGGMDQVALTLGHNETLIKLAQDDNLLGTMCFLKSEGLSQRASMFIGISKAEIEALVARYQDEETRKTMETHECLIVHLSTSSLFTIYRRLQSNTKQTKMSANKEKEIREKAYDESIEFTGFFNAAMWLNIVHGALWFYKLQAPGVPLMDRDYPLDKVAIPRWMVKKWRVTKDSSGVIDSCEPHEWACLPWILEYPDATSLAFIASLGVTREAEHQRVSIERMISSKDGEMKGRFRQLSTHPGQYLVEVSIPKELKADENWKQLKPAVDTRLSMKIVDPRFKLRFRGQVTDDIFATEGATSDFVVGVSGPVVELPYEDLAIDITLRDDPVASNRALNAIEILSRGFERTHGVDLCRDLFGSPPTVAKEKLAALVTKFSKDELDATLVRFRDVHKLNDNQAKAAAAFITEAYTLVWGPAGTGKTKVCSTAVVEVAEKRIKQVVCCPTNRAVEKALEDSLKIKPDLKAVRFIGGIQHTQDVKSRPAGDTAMDVDAAPVADPVAEEDKDELAELYINQLDVKDATSKDHLFHIKKAEAIKDYARDDNHPQCKNAREYAKLRDDLAKASGKDRQETLQELRRFDKPLHEYFLDHGVDVIFVTCASASNDALETFKAEVVTVDEAGQATLADICMATAPFKETILSLNLTGDHVQLGPVVIADKENEALRMLQTSHFENHIKTGGEEWPHHMLQEHYRSHPDITAFPNESLYQGKLINDASTSVPNGMQGTLKQFLAPLGTAWNKKWRMGVNVSGVSDLYGNTHSACNEKEADFIVDFVVKMVNFVPKEEGIVPKPERIVLKDIGIQSPYKGQVRMIDRKLFRAGIDSKMLAYLVTTASIQGNDADIVITSGVAAHKDDVNKGLRYTAEADKIAVNTTRARYLDVYVANFGPAIEFLHTKQKGSTAMLVSKNCAMYRALVEHLHNTGSIVSAGDFGRSVLADKPDLLLKSGHNQRYDYKLEKGSKVQPTGMGQREARTGAKRKDPPTPTGSSAAASSKRTTTAAGSGAAGPSWRAAAAAGSSAAESSKQAAATTSTAAPKTDVASTLGDLTIGSSAKQKKKDDIKAKAAALGLTQTQYKKQRKEIEAASREAGAKGKEKGKGKAPVEEGNDDDIMGDD